MEPKFSPPSKGGISGLKVIFFFTLLPLGAIFGGVVDFFLCKRGGEGGKEGFSANEKKAWRKIWCGFFFQCGCNGHGALGVVFSFSVVITGTELYGGGDVALPCI